MSTDIPQRNFNFFSFNFTIIALVMRTAIDWVEGSDGCHDDQSLLLNLRTAVVASALYQSFCIHHLYNINR